MSRFAADGREILAAKVERVVQRNYPTETLAADDAANPARVGAAGLDAVVVAWLMGTRLLAVWLRVGDAGHEKAGDLLSVGLQFADRVDDETAETVRERVREVGDARGD